MAEYIFYTTEGFTQDSEGNQVENCQLLGKVFGEGTNEARNNLLKENPWIKEHGYDVDMFICRELAPCDNAEKRMAFLTELLDERQFELYTNWCRSAELI